MPNKTNQGWEKRFFKLYPELFIILKGKEVDNKKLRYLLENKVFEVIDFIRQTIKEEREEAVREFLGSDEGKVYQDYIKVKK